VPARALPQCEPTLTCEGYRFELRKAPDETTRNFGPFVNRFNECLSEGNKLQKQIDGLTASSQPSQVQAIKTALINLANHHSIVNCDLIKRISDISSTGPINEVKQALSAINFELAFACVCSALLPPCAPPEEENCIALATVTLNCRQGCNVVKICNVENRRQLVTLPALKYWFEGLLVALRLGDTLRNFCCRAREFQPGTVSRPDAVNSFLNQMMTQGETMNSQAVFKHLGTLMKEIAAFTRQ